MTEYETIMVVLGVISMLISFGMLVISLLTFLKKKKKRNK